MGLSTPRQCRAHRVRPRPSPTKPAGRSVSFKLPIRSNGLTRVPSQLPPEDAQARPGAAAGSGPDPLGNVSVETKRVAFLPLVEALAPCVQVPACEVRSDEAFSLKTTHTKRLA